jgi:hypothetical protein
MRLSLMPLFIEHFDLGVVHMLYDLAQVQYVKPLIARWALHNVIGFRL